MCDTHCREERIAFESLRSGRRFVVLRIIGLVSHVLTFVYADTFFVGLGYAMHLRWRNAPLITSLVILPFWFSYQWCLMSYYSSGKKTSAGCGRLPGGQPDQFWAGGHHHAGRPETLDVQEHSRRETTWEGQPAPPSDLQWNSLLWREYQWRYDWFFSITKHRVNIIEIKLNPEQTGIIVTFWDLYFLPGRLHMQ